MSASSTDAYAFDRIDPRTRRVTPALIRAVLAQIIRELHPRQVILFGSQAWGKSRPRSDIDLFIRLDDTHPFASMSRSERVAKTLDIFRYRLFGLDVMVLTEGEIKSLEETNEGEWDLVLEILAKGWVLYERQSA